MLNIRIVPTTFDKILKVTCEFCNRETIYNDQLLRNCIYCMKEQPNLTSIINSRITRLEFHTEDINKCIDRR